MSGRAIDRFIDAMLREGGDELLLETGQTVRISACGVERNLLAQSVRTHQIENLIAEVVPVVPSWQQPLGDHLAVSPQVVAFDRADGRWRRRVRARSAARQRDGEQQSRHVDRHRAARERPTPSTRPSPARPTGTACSGAAGQRARRANPDGSARGVHGARRVVPRAGTRVRRADGARPGQCRAADATTLQCVHAEQAKHSAGQRGERTGARSYPRWSICLAGGHDGSTSAPAGRQ